MSNSESSPMDSGVLAQYKHSLYKPLPDSMDEAEDDEADSPIEPPTVVALKSFGESCDLIAKLQNKTHKAQYLVSSSVLQLVSQVWAKSINRKGFAELKKESIGGKEYPVLDFKDDEIYCLDTLFSIIHFQCSYTPRTLTFSQLRSMTLICDKYNCWSGLYLWKDIWFKYLIEDADLPGYEDWLFIAARGNYKHKNIDNLKRALVCGASTLSPCKSYFYRYEKASTGIIRYRVRCELIPQQTIDLIMDKRKQAVLEMVACLRKFAALVSGVGHGDDGVQEVVCKNTTCSNLALGSFYSSLKKNKLWPLVHANSCADIEWHGSLYELAEKIRSLKMTTVITQDNQTNISVISNSPPPEASRSFLGSSVPSTGGPSFAMPLSGLAPAFGSSSGQAFGSASTRPAFGSTSSGFGSTSGGFGSMSGGFGSTSGGFGSASGGFGSASGGFGSTSASSGFGGFGSASGGSQFGGNTQSSNPPQSLDNLQPPLNPEYGETTSVSSRHPSEDIIKRLEPMHQGQCHFYTTDMQAM
ncbi:hypothetical protein AA313_de0201292 [Arthrobotrys entomopaga]|nr:hypothetical protein AA313_de0201292 [Arthrobotrys entomopaga]